MVATGSGYDANDLRCYQNLIATASGSEFVNPRLFHFQNLSRGFLEREKGRPTKVDRPLFVAGAWNKSRRVSAG
jgi:hypothetical protein